VYYQPRRTLGLLVGAVLASWSAAIGVLLVNAGLTAGTGLAQLAAYGGGALAATLALLFCYWCYGLATLAYRVDRNGLVIEFGTTRQVIPLDAIERLVPERSLGAVPRVRGISWPGCHIGRADLDRIGEVLVYSAHQSPEQLLYVMTSARTYALSVEDPTRFAEEIQRRQRLGPTAVVTHRAERWGIPAQSLWHDRRALVLLAVALACALAMWAQVAIRYPDLPAALDIIFPPGADPGHLTLVERSALLELPRVATALLVINLAIGALAHGRSRAASHVLFLAAAGAQLALLAAFAVAVA